MLELRKRSGTMRWGASALAAVGMWAGQPVASQDKTAVKTAIVYNVLRFITFQGGADQLELCVRRQDAMAAGLRSLQGRSVSGLTINVVLFENFSQVPAQCKVIYLGATPFRSLPTPGLGQITIGESATFVEQGGTIGLVNFGSQIRFTINLRSAQNARVRISSQLMQLAAKVVL